MAKEILGVLCSGRGTNLQSILAAVDSGQIPAPVGVVLTDKPEAKALERAEKAGIPAELSVERIMRCGVGLCGSCALDDGRCACREGPVLRFG